MNASGAPAFFWLLCLQYVCVLVNYRASPALRCICPRVAQINLRTNPSLECSNNHERYTSVANPVEKHHTGKPPSPVQVPVSHLSVKKFCPSIGSKRSPRTNEGQIQMCLCLKIYSTNWRPSILIVLNNA